MMVRACKGLNFFLHLLSRRRGCCPGVKRDSAGLDWAGLGWWGRARSPAPASAADLLAEAAATGDGGGWSSQTAF